MTGKYLEQYERMKRSYEKFARIKQGRSHDMPSVNYEDEIYTFFQNCHHLKDWIKNDKTIRARIRTIGSDVENFVRESEPLMLSADLCNSLKHLENRNRSGENPTFGPKHYNLELGSGPPTIKMDWSVERDTKGPVDAFDLANECVKAWDQFMSNNGL
jgi:hypothetical protein